MSEGERSRRLPCPDDSWVGRAGREFVYNASLRTTLYALELLVMMVFVVVEKVMVEVMPSEPARAHLICCFTCAAPELRLTGVAHQAGLLPSRCVVQRVLVELEAAELLEALLALVLVVLARRVPSLCAPRAHEVSVQASMLLYRIHVPRPCIKHASASRAPVAVEGKALSPDIIAFDTTLAS